MSNDNVTNEWPNPQPVEGGIYFSPREGWFSVRAIGILHGQITAAVQTLHDPIEDDEWAAVSDDQIREVAKSRHEMREHLRSAGRGSDDLLMIHSPVAWGQLAAEAHLVDTQCVAGVERGEYLRLGHVQRLLKVENRLYLEASA
ncbi:MAG TPA: hypothetical protein PKZ35_08835 [Gammaproteobacteria bacterium]|nr:hypothetical protein [Gammaproteobacteria bacterium]